jgi:hypothetical protein
MKVGRLKRAGHVVRTDLQPTVKRILNAKPEGSRKGRKPEMSWEVVLYQAYGMLVIRIITIPAESCKD